MHEVCSVPYAAVRAAVACKTRETLEFRKCRTGPLHASGRLRCEHAPFVPEVLNPTMGTFLPMAGASKQPLLGHYNIQWVTTPLETNMT